MKMTLSSPNSSNANDKLNTNSENRPVSPSNSPRSSPRPSPRPQTKREHSKSDTLLTVNYNRDQQTANKTEGSPSSQESGSSRTTAAESNLVESKLELSASSSTKDRKEPRSKKKSWFNSFYPTYKSRSGDFRRIFKEVPDDERLVVDYSCALQKEILVQGRLYVTQNYLCFYANIFGWETTVTLKWKDVSAITKEKTAIVIPNAVLICTRNDKYFFTSFVAREKTYLMLFRVWQNALMDQPMPPQEMWQWVHQCYGDELGLTSDDEDYIAPRTEEDKLSARLSVESFSEEGGSAPEVVPEPKMAEEKHPEEGFLPQTKSESANNIRRNVSESRLATDMSDTTESDGEKHAKCDFNVQCTSAHEGRQLLSQVFPIHVDQLFTLLFTSSKFYLDFHASRKTTDLTQTPWTHSALDNSKSRIVHLTLALNNAMGPKTAQVTESQVMLPCSKAGYLYAIDVDTIHAGIPYADSFNVVVHYCLQKVTENETLFMVYGQVKYKKSVFTLIRSMIERNCWSGLEDYFSSLVKSLTIETEENVPDVKRRSRRKRRIHTMPRPGIEDPRSLICPTNRIKLSTGGVFSSDVSTMIVFFVLVLLVVLNVLLYLKLWSLEDSPPYTIVDLHTLKNPPKSHEEWIKLLQQQETLHAVEIQKWQRVLKTAINLLKQTEESLNELQRSISPSYANKVMSILQNHEDANQNSEL